MAEYKYYLIRRLLTFIPTILGALFITFIVSHVVPMMPAKAGFARHLNLEALKRLEQLYHLDKPWWEQFAYYVRDLFTGHWGTSMMSGRPIFEDLRDYYPVTVQLAIAGEALILLIGVPLGIVAAMKQDKWIDYVIRVFSLVAYSMPYFLWAIGIQLLFYWKLGWFPGIGLGKPPAKIYTGMYLLDSLLCGDWSSFIDNLRHLFLPAFSLALPNAGVIARLMRGSLLDALSSEYIDYTRMKGLPERMVVLKHAMKNAIIPIITVGGLMFGGLLGGAFITETVFALAGAGRYTVMAVLRSMDIPVIMATTFLIVMTYLLVNLVVDLLYGAVDPRVRL
ncbi:MAG: peptide ABC transporter permease [Thermofilum sp. ex4484_15]|nr:MAG: peptide ABC transporter permease [Thermofilum sp. ex4484_15]